MRNRPVILTLAICVAAWLLPAASLLAAPRVCATACNTQVVAATAIAVPVAVPTLVPQYVAAQVSTPVAAASYVQYGAGTSTSTADTSSLEDRIAQKILASLQKSGALPAAALPSLVAKNCAQCHRGADAKGGLDLSDLSKLDCETRLAAVNRLLSDDPAKRMPPAGSGVTLSADDLGKVLQELSQQVFSNSPAAPAPAPAPEVKK